MKRLWAEEEINEIAKKFQPGESVRLYDEDYSDYAELSSYGLIIDYSKLQGDGTKHVCEVGVYNDSFAVEYYEDDGPKCALSLNGDGIAIDGTDIYIGGYATNDPDSITLAKNPKQPSIELSGNAMHGGSNVGTYTIRYIPLYDKSGNLVGGSGTIAISLTSTIADSMVALEGTENIKAAILAYSSSNTAVAGAIVSGILVCALPSTNLSGNIEGSISVFNN